MNPLIDQLLGTDRRSIGKANEVAAQILVDPTLFAPVFEGMLGEDDVLRMRCADVIEKVTLTRADLLVPYKERLIHEVAQIDQQEVRWHLAQLFSRLQLSSDERAEVAAILTGFMQDKSSIVRTFSMQALADLALQDEALRPSIVAQIDQWTVTGSPAMRSRGRKLIAKLAAKG